MNKLKKEIIAWSLYDFANQGKLTLIELSAAWCGPCNDVAGWLSDNDQSITDIN